MAGQEVGVAYYSLLPSGKGFGKAVEKELDTAADGHEKKQKSLWSNVTKYGAIAAAAIGALFTAKILSGGLSRALNIEDAQAKLKGLGHDAANITAIMEDALNAVRGTAFGLDAAATIAASAVAAGVKPGQELERYLRLTADAATIAGVSLDEMGAILNKATTAGKVYTLELNQLADRGLPIFQWLQEEYGVTAEELRKMVAAGQVDAATFRKVIEENIGGAALASGDTTRGAFANMQAAMSRWGANLLTGVLPFAKQFFNEMIVIFDGLSERSAPFIDKFNEWLSGLQVDGLGERFLGWLDNLDLSTITDTFVSLKPIFDVVRDLGPQLKELAPPLRDLLIAVLPLVPELTELAVSVLPVLVSLLALIVPLLIPIITRLTEVFDALQLIIDTFSGRLSPREILAGFEELGGMGEQIMATAGPVGEAIARLVSAVHAGFSAVVTAGRNLMTFLGELWENIGLIVGDGLRIVVGIFTGNEELIAEGQEGLRERLSGIWVSLRDAVTGFAGQTWSRVSSAFSSGIDRAVEFVQSLPARITAVFESMPERMAALGRNIVQGLINGITGMISNAVRSVTNLSSSMLSGMKNWLGIKSPSRVFRDQVGAEIAAGVIAGVDGMQVQTDTAIRSLVTVPSVRVPDAEEADVPDVFGLSMETLLTLRDFIADAVESRTRLMLQAGVV